MTIGEGTRSERDLRAVPAQTAPTQAQLTGRFWTRAVLDSLPSDWTVLHGRHWLGRTYDVVDHVVVGPTGIFVVDSVGWSGEVTVTPDLLDVNGRPRLTAVQAAHETARDVALLLSPDLRDHVFPVICFSREEAISGWVKAVRICSTATLDELIETRDVVFTTDQVRRVSAELDTALPSSQTTMGERSRVTDLGDVPTSDASNFGTTSEPRWHRSRAGRVTQGALALGIVAGVTLVGFHLAQVDAASNDVPGHHQPAQPGTR